MGHLRAVQAHHMDYLSKVDDSTADESYGEDLTTSGSCMEAQAHGAGMDNEDHEIIYLG